MIKYFHSIKLKIINESKNAYLVKGDKIIKIKQRSNEILLSWCKSSFRIRLS